MKRRCFGVIPLGILTVQANTTWKAQEAHGLTKGGGGVGTITATWDAEEGP